MTLSSLPGDTKIYRALDKNGLLCTLGIFTGAVPDRSKLQSLSPTLLLRSLGAYAKMEGEKGDPTENGIYAIHRTAGLNIDPTLVSCWSLTKSFTTFSNTVAVIESTVDDIHKIMTWASEVLCDSNIVHSTVHYYEIGTKDPELDKTLLPHGFAKPKKYECETEYRFLMKHKHPNVRMRLDDFKISLSHHTDFRYIRHIHLSPTIEKKFSCYDLRVLKEVANMHMTKWEAITHHAPDSIATT
ncbi:MAG: hypothetical protein COY58_09325 [Gammaproteobacteria bacterium CG_4_10_14_0_8_um_filter_38_16]|nr:MAG: hypothetical protein COY58_09325 [Gammaproteobacteria bacterium CG_4_10_14_0_8_um_filter_38_16]PJA03573.1 MAG: hypothetical protein COX72_04525 [Gammaproteobacteria bacterium CG_4_10_14_0_2_um_filter_38_22]PJB10142.1 MAG: hypothetical protein CO120_06435 [Gammaproteobacteria bacterium CG_4_9_14_3_um_filter_38_9]